MQFRNNCNESADKLAKEAVGVEEVHEFRRLLSAQKRENREGMFSEWTCVWQASKYGKYLKGIDESLPSKRALHLHGSHTRNRSFYFMQLRTDHTLLNSSGVR